MENILLVGFGGHARSVADCIERRHKYRILGYTDVESRDSKYKYLGTDTVFKEYFEQGVRNAALGIGYIGKGVLREQLYEKLKDIGYNLPIICDPSAIISENAQIGEGTFIGKGAIVNTKAQIGKMAIINTMALVEHESIVGDFCHIAVGAILCGQVKVEKGVFVGANATILQCMNIPSGVIIPAGEIVRRNYNITTKDDCKIIQNFTGGVN